MQVLTQYEDFLYFDLEECDEFIDPDNLNKQKSKMDFVYEVLWIKKKRKAHKKFNLHYQNKQVEETSKDKEDEKVIKNFNWRWTGVIDIRSLADTKVPPDQKD